MSNRVEGDNGPSMLTSIRQEAGKGEGWGLGYIMYSVYFIVLDEDTVLECAGWGLGSATHLAVYRHSFPRRGSWGRRAWGWVRGEVQRDGGHAGGAETQILNARVSVDAQNRRGRRSPSFPRAGSVSSPDGIHPLTQPCRGFPSSASAS